MKSKRDRISLKLKPEATASSPRSPAQTSNSGSVAVEAAKKAPDTPTSRTQHAKATAASTPSTSTPTEETISNVQFKMPPKRMYQTDMDSHVAKIRKYASIDLTKQPETQTMEYFDQISKTHKSSAVDELQPLSPESIVLSDDDVDDAQNENAVPPKNDDKSQALLSTQTKDEVKNAVDEDFDEPQEREHVDHEIKSGAFTQVTHEAMTSTQAVSVVHRVEGNIVSKQTQAPNTYWDANQKVARATVGTTYAVIKQSTNQKAAQTKAETALLELRDDIELKKIAITSARKRLEVARARYCEPKLQEERNRKNNETECDIRDMEIELEEMESTEPILQRKAEQEKMRFE